MNVREIVCPDLNAALEDWRGRGFRIDWLYPADEPQTAGLSCEGAELRLTTRPGEPPLPDHLPPFRPEFVLTRADGGSVVGRAGMGYRDLIPGRLGGRYIASHITIVAGGPVDDWVHYHAVAVQMIFVRSGWVKVVYEDQGRPFVMRAGDLVLQPPYIRHRVLESSPALEVIEIGCPAVHKTCTEHQLALPNGTADRLFAGQRFLRHVAADARWAPIGGGEAQETGMRDATAGLADVRTVRTPESASVAIPAHDGELVFGFVLGGTARLGYQEGHDIVAGDAFVIPPGDPWSVLGTSVDFELLHVTTARMPAQIPAGPSNPPSEP